MRGRILIASASTTVAACSLFTDLGGYAQVEVQVPIEGGATDGSEGGTSTDTGTGNDAPSIGPDGGGCADALLCLPFDDSAGNNVFAYGGGATTFEASSAKTPANGMRSFLPAGRTDNAGAGMYIAFFNAASPVPAHFETTFSIRSDKLTPEDATIFSLSFGVPVHAQMLLNMSTTALVAKAGLTAISWGSDVHAPLDQNWHSITVRIETTPAYHLEVGIDGQSWVEHTEEKVVTSPVTVGIGNVFTPPPNEAIIAIDDLVLRAD